VNITTLLTVFTCFIDVQAPPPMLSIPWSCTPAWMCSDCSIQALTRISGWRGHQYTRCLVCREKIEMSFNLTMYQPHLAGRAGHGMAAARCSSSSDHVVQLASHGVLACLAEDPAALPCTWYIYPEALWACEVSSSVAHPIAGPIHSILASATPFRPGQHLPVHLPG
jgi:hypothetical protein